MNQNENTEQGNQTQPQTPLSQTPEATQPPASEIAPSPPTQQIQGLGQVEQGVQAGTSSDAQVDLPAIEDTWQAKYEKARKRSKILACTTAAACVLAVGAGVWGITKSSSPQPPDFASGQFPGGGPGGFGGPGGQGGLIGQGGPGRMLADLFNSDGSVNTEKVNEFKSRMPSGSDPTQLVDQAQQSGAITADQATKLKAALGGSTSGNSSYSEEDEDDSSGAETA